MITTRISQRHSDFGPDPKLTITVQGTHDVGRIVHLLARGRVEEIIAAAEAVRKLRRLPGGIAALQSLAQAGGPDYMQEYPGGHDPAAGE